MSEQPTHDPAATYRSELRRRGITPTAEVRDWAREQLDGARNRWTPARLAAVRARSGQATADRPRTDSPAA